MEIISAIVYKKRYTDDVRVQALLFTFHNISIEDAVANDHSRTLAVFYPKLMIFKVTWAKKGIETPIQGKYILRVCAISMNSKVAAWSMS